MSRRLEAIDLMKLWSVGNYVSWNAMLKKHLDDKNINGLASYRYQIQAGMDDLAKQKLNTPEIDLFYVRLLRSLEKTAKKIITIKHPMPGDNVLVAKSWGPEWLETKRKRDRELARFMTKSSY